MGVYAKQSNLEIFVKSLHRPKEACGSKLSFYLNIVYKNVSCDMDLSYLCCS